MNTVYRQGDVILREVKVNTKLMRKVGDLFTQSGETGHIHTLQAKVYEEQPGIKVQYPKIIEVGEGGSIILHPEHPSLPIKPGTYVPDRVRTFTPKMRQTTYAYD
jgi:hypothetical protein